MSPASATYRASTPVENQLDDDSNPLPPPDSTQSGDLPITSALTSAFLDSLSTYDVDIRFFCGTWESIDIQATGGIYDVVLTSETIYRMESLPPLVNLMRRACIAEPSLDESLRTKAETLLSISSRETSKMQEPTCLVAAKLVYFGVGGGVAEFVKAIEGSNETGRKGDVENVWETRDGVRRCIMRVQWL